jgi:hypothetical protein
MHLPDNPATALYSPGTAPPSFTPVQAGHVTALHRANAAPLAATAGQASDVSRRTIPWPRLMMAPQLDSKAVSETTNR